MTSNYLAKHRSVFIYGMSLAFLLLLLKWLEWRFVILNYALGFYAGGIAVLFTGLGIWLALKLSSPKTIVVEKHIAVKPNFTFNADVLNSLSISRRELEVLQLMAEGLSNRQIGDRLFVSLSTIKTHTSNLFEKLEVQRRTQAVQKARLLNLIP